MTDIVEILERQYARTGLKYILEAANEIERLRDTLRHVIANPWDYDAKRVREALGDE